VREEPPTRVRREETAKLAGVNPKTYLLEATHAALPNPGTTLLPHALLP
jgi:hypothetical protein